MKSVNKYLRLFLLCLSFIFLLPLCANAQIEGTRDIWIYVDRAAVPAGTARLELLVPAREAAVVDCNEKNCAAASIPTDCGIVAYEADGCVSLSFRTLTEKQDGRLIYQIFFRLSDKEREKYADLLSPVEQYAQDEGGAASYMIPTWIGEPEEQTYLSVAAAIPGAEVENEAYCGFYYDAAAVSPAHDAAFTSVKAAYLDAQGNVLAVSDACSAAAANGYGAELRLSGTVLTPAPKEGDYYYNPVLPILLAAVVTLLFAVLLLSLLRVCMTQRKKRFLPAFFFQKTKQREKVSGKKRGAALLVFLIRLVYFAVIAGLIFSVEKRLAWDGDWWPPLAVFAGDVLIYLLVTALNVGAHEVGHVLLGKKAGFRPVYIMVCGFGMKKENGRLRCSYHGLRLNGFVALEPPQNEPTDISFAPMYLGGIMMNGILGAVFLVLYFIFNSMAWSGILLVSAMQSFYIAWINNEASGFVRGIPGDVEQLRNLCRSAYSAALHTDTMRISAAYYKGETVSEMPEEWFHASVAVPDDPCVACNAAAMFARLLALGAFEEAVELGMRLAAPESALQTALKAQVLTDLVLCMAATGATKEAIEAFYSRERRQAVLCLRPRAGQLRSKYAYELLVEKKPELAQKTRALYEKRYAKRGLPAVVAMDVALMDACATRYGQKTET